MKLLAIDTSTDTASVALLLDEELLHTTQGNQRTQAQFLLPMIDKLIVDSGLQMSQLDGIIFGCGPGSFTGLRIACSVAKGLAYAHDLGLIPVSNLAAIAWSARQKLANPEAPILAVLDARMHEMYWAYYSAEQYTAKEGVNPVTEIHVPEHQPVVLAGVGIDEYWPDFSEAVKGQIREKLTLYPDAAAMIQLAQATAIQPIAAADAQPVYVRNNVTYDKKS